MGLSRVNNGLFVTLTTEYYFVDIVCRQLCVCNFVLSWLQQVFQVQGDICHDFHELAKYSI